MALLVVERTLHNVSSATQPMDHENRPESLVGQRVGGWLLERFLERGGSGAVYVARDDSRPIAVKVYYPRLFEAPNVVAERTRLELQATLAGHDIPYLVGVESTGQCDQTKLFYIAMEHHDAPSLDKQIATLPHTDIPVIMHQVATAAYALHSRRLVHRDIKPANIIWSGTSRVATLLDLGVLRQVGVSAGTHHGKFLGTYRYSPPEFAYSKVEDNADDDGPWVAVTFYQMGGVLHDLIMRRRMFDECINDHELHRAIDQVDPRIEAEGVPDHWTDLARRCLEKDPGHRLRAVKWEDFGVSTATASPAPAVGGTLSDMSMSPLDPRLGAVAQALRAAVTSATSRFPPVQIEPAGAGLLVRFGTALRLGFNFETHLDLRVEVGSGDLSTLRGQFRHVPPAGGDASTLTQELPPLPFPSSQDAIQEWLLAAFRATSATHP